MKDRKTFLVALGIVGASLALAKRTDAQAVPSASAPARAQRPLPKPRRRVAAKRPSAAALAVAATFRRFDPKLDDAEIETIARGIDDGYKSGATLDPKRKPLHNWNEPVTVFTVDA